MIRSGLAVALPLALLVGWAADAQPAHPGAEMAEPPVTLGAAGPQAAIGQLGRQAQELIQGIPDSRKKLEELQSALGRNLNDAKTAAQAADQLMAMLADYRKRLGEGSAFFQLLQQAEAVAEKSAHEAETDTDPEIRKMADTFRQDAAEIGKIRARFVEKSTEMVFDIDRLGRLKHRMEFTQRAASIEQFVKNAQAYLDIVTADAQKIRSLANGLSTMGQPPVTE